MAFNRRNTLPRKPSSTPAPTRRVAPPISISIAAATRTAFVFRQHRNKIRADAPD
jgi:hypothetical protein